jgi:hypothetical protein
MKKMLFLFLLSCFGFLGFSQDADTLNKGAIHIKFENYIPKKQWKYNLEIQIKSEEMLTILKSNLGDRLSENDSWLYYLPVGVYTVSVKLRSNYSLNIRKIEITTDRVRFIKIDMNDARSAFKKVRIDREYRN